MSVVFHSPYTLMISENIVLTLFLVGVCDDKRALVLENRRFSLTLYLHDMASGSGMHSAGWPWDMTVIAARRNHAKLKEFTALFWLSLGWYGLGHTNLRRLFPRFSLG